MTTQQSMTKMSIAKSDFSQRLFFIWERKFSEEDVLAWLRTVSPCTWVCVALYLGIIFGLQRFMKNRTPLNLRPALVAWSAFLALFSIIGATRLIPERFYTIQTHGWTYSVCTMEYHSGPVGFWTFLFVLSKVFELGDTLFIVLRKHKLILLHWYHHVVVMICVFYATAVGQPFGRWFATINYTVHAIMYSYYTLRALRIRVPKIVAMMITAIQIAQVSFFGQE